MKNLKTKWLENKESYKTREIGSGVHSFVSDIFKNPELFSLKETASKTGKLNTFVHDETGAKRGRPDFTLFITKDILIPCEVKCFTRIKEGEKQLLRYQTDFNKKYGILTDGNEWRFYKSTQYKSFFIEDILENPKDFMVYWKSYIKPENYYLELFNPSGQQSLFENRLDLNLQEDRVVFFDEITQVINNFKGKMKAIGVDLFEVSDKKAVEVSYAYLIQFILYKVLVDNEFKTFSNEYKKMFEKIQKALKDKDFYSIIIHEMKNISEYISEKIYPPFKEEQKAINEKLIENLKKSSITIDVIAPWLDIIIFINRYNFAGLKNEIFGFIYENFLKDLYQDTNKGQYFTDPAVVNFMLKEIGYTEKVIKEKAPKNEISIIDPSCGAGTFLYSAVDKIIDSFNDGTKKQSLYIEDLIDKNIFGLDIEEFPLYLAEMNILMRLLPLVVNDDFENPIDNKLKIFKTKDSISEFLDVGITSKEDKVDLFSHIKKTALDYPSFMRDEKDLEAMLKSLQEKSGVRERFDFVIGNPPYIGYNQCCKQKIDFTQKIKDKNDDSITLGDVYGMNLHSVPENRKKYPPKPNLYSFFIALGLGLLKDGGKIAYIIPQTILTAGMFDVLRYHLSELTTIEKVITFAGNLFVGRGLKQNKPVATSSLIFVVKKKIPLLNHKVKVINYLAYKDKKGIDFEKYVNSRKKTTEIILQSELRDNIENWSFLKHGALFRKILKHLKSLQSLKLYYDHSLSKQYLNSKFIFDIGYGIDEKKLSNASDFYVYPKLEKKYLTIKNAKGYLSKNTKIPLLENNQGHDLLNTKYKILWSYNNPSRFHYSNLNLISSRNNICYIGSNNKQEILFLVSILNSKLKTTFLKKLLISDNEKAFLVAISSIKQHIRVPKIDKSNPFIKDEIIKQTEKLLALEDYQLKDFVNFDTRIQRFIDVKVEGNNLILIDMKQNEIKQKIKSKSAFVKKLIEQEYPQGWDIDKSLTLHELKFEEAIDKDEQTIIKGYIDDLVFSLYFNIPVKKIGLNEAENIKKLCKKNEFYDYINKE